MYSENLDRDYARDRILIFSADSQAAMQAIRKLNFVITTIDNEVLAQVTDLSPDFRAYCKTQCKVTNGNRTG